MYIKHVNCLSWSWILNSIHVADFKWYHWSMGKALARTRLSTTLNKNPLGWRSISFLKNKTSSIWVLRKRSEPNRSEKLYQRIETETRINAFSSINRCLKALNFKSMFWHDTRGCWQQASPRDAFFSLIPWYVMTVPRHWIPTKLVILSTLHHVHVECAAGLPLHSSD